MKKLHQAIVSQYFFIFKHPEILIHFSVALAVFESIFNQMEIFIFGVFVISSISIALYSHYHIAVNKAANDFFDFHKISYENSPTPCLSMLEHIQKAGYLLEKISKIETMVYDMKYILDPEILNGFRSLLTKNPEIEIVLRVSLIPSEEILLEFNTAFQGNITLAETGTKFTKHTNILTFLNSEILFWHEPKHISNGLASNSDMSKCFFPYGAFLLKGSADEAERVRNKIKDRYYL